MLRGRAQLFLTNSRISPIGLASLRGQGDFSVFNSDHKRREFRFRMKNE